MKMIDMHCDSLTLPFLTGTEKKDTYLRENNAMVDLQKLKKGNSLAQFFAIFIPYRYLEPMFNNMDPWDFTQMIYKSYLNELKLNADLILPAKNYNDIIKNNMENKLSSILTIEEGGILENKIERLDELYSMGVRLITLIWNDENCIGYPNSSDEQIMNKGLKPFGIEVVKKMNDLGMMVDVSHISDGGFWDVVKYSKSPIVASHSNSRIITNHKRNLSDDMIKAIANSGGVIGINYGPEFVIDKKVSQEGESRVADIVKHIIHIKKVGGIDVLGLGSDFDGVQGNLEIENSGQINKLYNSLEISGFTENEIEKISHTNVLRVIKNIL